MTTERPETSSFREFADIAHCKPSWVTQLKKAGRLVLTGDGKRVRVLESLQRIEDTRDPSKAAVAARHAAERDAHTEDTETPAPEPQSSEYQRARAEREAWTAKQARLDYERSAGLVLEAAAVESTIAHAVTVFRKSLETLPEIVAASSVGKNETQIRELVTHARDNALAELAREFQSITKTGAA